MSITSQTCEPVGDADPWDTNVATCREIGAPGRIRTCDLKIRSLLLYPTELRARGKASIRKEKMERETGLEPATLSLEG